MMVVTRDRVRRIERTIAGQIGAVRYQVSDTPEGAGESSTLLTEAQWENLYCHPERTPPRVN